METSMYGAYTETAALISQITPTQHVELLTKSVALQTKKTYKTEVGS
jgi:hypothetical protein